MSDQNLLVSILTPAYQCGRFLRQMGDSILAQTYENWELIITDDGSNDLTWDVANELSREDRRIKPLRIPHGGHAVALNVCIQRASGDLIARQDADDWSVPERLERQICCLLAEDADLCSCLMVRVRQGDGRRILGRNTGGSGMVPLDFCTKQLTKGPATATIVARKAVYDRVGLYNTEAPGHMIGSTDSDWLFRCLLVNNPPFKWAHVHDEMYCYRNHRLQCTKQHARLGRHDHNMFRDKYAPIILERLMKKK